MDRSAFLSGLLQTIADRGRLLLDRVRGNGGVAASDVPALCESLLASRGEASGVALAHEILSRWQALDDAGRIALLTTLADRFGPDFALLDKAVEAYRGDKTARTVLDLHGATEPRRRELIRRLSLAPGGVEVLVQMREYLLKHQGEHPGLALVDDDFVDLFSSWFNREFLVLRRIDWTTQANILEKIIEYEAVHTIRGWNDLRRRIEPPDRCCFAFFHPQLVDDPLIFVEVALTRNMPAKIDDLLAEERTPMPSSEATTAVFYSISNCQDGLKGISFGYFLIKQVIEELRRELPRLADFVTLSPVPGFADWLRREGQGAATEADARALASLAEENWPDDAAKAEAIRKALPPVAAHYFIRARDAKARPVDPVARFHLGNGARLERLNFLGDRSPRALRQAHGLMVNYRYKLDDIEKNHELFVGKGEVIAAPEVRRLLRQGRSRHEPRAAASGRDAIPDMTTDAAGAPTGRQ